MQPKLYFVRVYGAAHQTFEQWKNDRIYSVQTVIESITTAYRDNNKKLWQTVYNNWIK